MIRGHFFGFIINIISVFLVFLAISVVAISSVAHAQSTNLILNGSLEASGTAAPANWSKIFWGTPAPTFTYPATGNGASRGASITLSANSTGGAYWAPAAVNVTAGKEYTYSFWYNSNVATEIDIEYQTSSGARSYAGLAMLTSSGGTWKQASVSFTVPNGKTKATIYQLINLKGILTIDDVTLSLNGGTTPPGTPTLTFAASPTAITNGQSSTLSWNSTNVTSCTASGGWTGTKTLSGTQTVTPLANTTYSLNCSGAVGNISKQVTVTVSTVTPPPPPPPPPGTFAQGMVSVTFDDSWTSQYNNALPILESAGIKGTFYLTSRPIQEGWSTFMTPSHVQSIATLGHEIAGHTVSHASLPTLSSSQMQTEITQSKTYLQNLTGKTVVSFAYPYGEYNSAAKTALQLAGYTSARGVEDNSLNVASSDKYNLKSSCIESPATFASVKAEIDKAKAQKQWYVLCFHEIKANPGQYDTSVALFQQIVNYIKSSGIKVVTVQEGRALMGN